MKSFIETGVLFEWRGTTPHYGAQLEPIASVFHYRVYPHDGKPEDYHVVMTAEALLEAGGRAEEVVREKVSELEFARTFQG